MTDRRKSSLLSGCKGDFAFLLQMDFLLAVFVSAFASCFSVFASGFWKGVVGLASSFATVSRAGATLTGLLLLLTMEAAGGLALAKMAVVGTTGAGTKLKNAFREHYGCTITEYMIQRRIHLSCCPCYASLVDESAARRSICKLAIKSTLATTNGACLIFKIVRHY